MRSWWVVVAALVLTGCSAPVAGSPTAVEPVDLALAIEVRPVLPEGELTTEPSKVLPDPAGEQLTMLDPILTIERLDSATITMDTTTWVLNIVLTADDATVFGDWTAEHTGERLALVADDEVIIAPQIQGAIPDGKVQLSGNYTRPEAQALLDKLTGK